MTKQKQFLRTDEGDSLTYLSWNPVPDSGGTFAMGKLWKTTTTCESFPLGLEWPV